MTSPIPWDPPLSFRWGAEERMCGIRVFHDFVWKDIFPNERTQFRNGQCLAKLIIENCPEGKNQRYYLR